MCIIKVRILMASEVLDSTDLMFFADFKIKSSSGSIWITVNFESFCLFY